MVSRLLKDRIEARMFQGKAILLFGPRQAGKTTLLRHLFSDRDVLWLNGDEPDVVELLPTAGTERLRSLLGNMKIVVIDEAQRIPDIGLVIKRMVDNLTDVQVIATGSSALDLASNTQEPLTGRKWEFRMHPLSYRELLAEHGLLQEQRLLAHRLTFGSYPEVVSRPGDEREVLQLLSESYLYKDLLMLEGIKKPEKLIKLLQALAYQLGNEVKYSELGSMVGLDNETVEKYVGLLEKAFVIFRLPSLNRNLRNELKLGRKVYFYDCGVRNAIIRQFAPLETRQDLGALWENYLVSERLKFNDLNGRWVNSYFWRTAAQQEIDYIEEENGTFSAFEFKWNPKRKVKFSSTFLNNYPVAATETISPGNMDSFI